MVKKILLLGVTLLMCLGILNACGGDELPYNAVLYDKVASIMNAEFLQENLTFGAWDEVNKQRIDDPYVPKAMTFIIDTQIKFDEIFKEFPVQINFETEVIILYGETTSSIRGFEIIKITLEESVLKIKIRTIKPKDDVPGGNVSPQARWTAIKMDKADFKSVEFI